MTKSFKLLMGTIALGIATIAPSQAQISVSSGSLLLSFYQDTGSGTFGANTYIYNIGSVQTWRENTTNTVFIANLDHDLDLAFGNGWASDTTLRMSLVGGFPTGSATAASFGDNPNTIYVSKGMASFAPKSTTPITVNSTNIATAALNIATNYLNNMNAEPLGGATDGGAIVPITNANDITNYVGFGIGASHNAAFGASTIGTGTGGYGVEAAVDLFRHLRNFTGTPDLTSGLGGTYGAALSGQYIGSFTIATNGDLRMDAVPEPSTVGMIALAGLALAGIKSRRRK